ncbi:AlpA family transcriptional regulator [Roseinatronobacter thiooxidans]|uniref:AlpA family transcriptional regulator n=1 Tax=Roseinatronobacter thiooxidans TaxID=121821 RepID=A0A2W7S2E4_9RHOB|nr:helix-turn-helix domain-containing protein [Roseinatronobacter thiooxidans]PZX44572.1 AlpA family transcriptional regulator [Roseinatronobacter thiooxidans]
MYLSDKQVAERYSVTRQTVWRWSRDRADFPKAITLSQGCTRWKLADLEAWEAQR